MLTKAKKYREPTNRLIGKGCTPLQSCAYLSFEYGQLQGFRTPKPLKLNGSIMRFLFALCRRRRCRRSLLPGLTKFRGWVIKTKMVVSDVKNISKFLRFFTHSSSAPPSSVGWVRTIPSPTTMDIQRTSCPLLSWLIKMVLGVVVVVVRR